MTKMMNKAIFYYYLKKTYPLLEPYDTLHRTNNLYIKEKNTVIIFDEADISYQDLDYVFILHDKDEKPNIKYFNYYLESETVNCVIKAVQYFLKQINENQMIQENKEIDYEKFLMQSIQNYDNIYKSSCIQYLIEEEDNVDLPIDYKGVNLLGWFSIQGKEYRLSYTYNDKELYVINPIDEWSRKFNMLQKYIAIHGSDFSARNVNICGCNLGPWITEQRTAYHEGYIRTERLSMLKEIGLSMTAFEDAWRHKYELLKQYKQEHGSVAIEKRAIYKGEKLGEWCQKQRDNYKEQAKALSLERISMLESLGFDWNPLETEWHRRYEQYKRYIQHNGGNPYIPRRTIFEGEKLGAWVETQKKAYKNGKLSINRLEKMQLIDPMYSSTI